MLRSITVERPNLNAAHVTLAAGDADVTVSLFGFGVGSFSDEKIISLAKDELQRKLDSTIFALVNVRPKGFTSYCKICMAPLPSLSTYTN